MGRSGRSDSRNDAEQIIALELKRRRWKEADLRTRLRGDPVLSEFRALRQNYNL